MFAYIVNVQKKTIKMNTIYLGTICSEKYVGRKYYLTAKSKYTLLTGGGLNLENNVILFVWESVCFLCLE